MQATRFELPAGCNCRSITMREIDGNDEIQAAVWAEKHIAPVLKKNTVALMGQEQFESIRVSVVAVDDKLVNLDGVAYREMDRWNLKTKRYLMAFYGELNGVTSDELEAAKTTGKAVTLDARRMPVESMFDSSMKSVADSSESGNGSPGI